MYIKQIEISNFRKLLAVRVDFAADKTVFVGANNSGKTSAMIALRRFLFDSKAFSINDLTLSHWKMINVAGDRWEEALKNNEAPPSPNSLLELMPFLDIWLHVGPGELHYVQKLIPTLDWTDDLIGVRLRYEPDDASALQQEYLKTRSKNADMLRAITGTAGAGASDEGANPSIDLWPLSLLDYLDRRMRKAFKVKAYLLDPAKLTPVVDGRANPQALPPDQEPIEGDPFDGLIRIDEISAQRGFGQAGPPRSFRNDGGSLSPGESVGGRKLSTQLRAYYDNHLDPYETPEPNDIKALRALEEARVAFDGRLKESFDSALKELEGLGYPGVTDPKLTISTKIRLQDSLSHDAAVQYEVPTIDADKIHRLPEDSNGLGYQNLVSMVFGLMSFRDAWMKVGKAGSGDKATTAVIPPLHLVLVEEPEAHLHAQVQQVFIKQAYEVLRNHKDLGKSTKLTTQLVVSTHSSHVAHACDFANLRYFRRLPASPTTFAVPIATVVNLTEVFGGNDQTPKFVTRYLKASHCDLFFADGAVLIEGSGERILVPHFVEERTQFDYLQRCYLTWLEIGGSHAHRLRDLIDHLGLTTLVITDLDAKNAASEAAESPKRGTGQLARNQTLKSWVPSNEAVDTLLDLAEPDKAITYPSGYAVRVAYQTPVEVHFKGNTGEALANTFEDALLYQNLPFFTNRKGTGLIGKFSKAIDAAADLPALAEAVRETLKDGGKAEFALDLLFSTDVGKLAVPTYIETGLLWLIEQLRRKEDDLAPKAAVA
ncbi:AAA family ATPase [Methylocystis sp.]|uniref:AAA family ATPase n=1 Tax=Methylocystis sp. TaxID=1911079 RepID=UPI003DA351B7